MTRPGAEGRHGSAEASRAAKGGLGGPSRPPIQLIVLWLSALVSAALGAWVLFDGAWGVNTVVWATVAMIGLLLCAAGGAGVSPALALAATLGVAIAGVTALTANGTLHGWTALALVVLLAVTSKLAEDGRSERIGWSFIVRSPLSAAVRFLGEAMRRTAHLAGRMAAERSQGWMRGALLALPVVVVFGLLLANADPVFATLRRSLEEVLRRWDFLPRLTFFGVLFVASLGAGGLALRGSTASSPISPPPPCPCLGRTERLVVLGAVAGLFGVFLLLQLTYLFGNAPAVAGSGITFAEYARRGFNELTIVATLCALLLMALDRHAQRGGREGAVRRVAWALVAETLLLLVSAFRRVWLYEDAYGFTTTRLYAQTYMIVMALVLLRLAWELRAVVDTRRLARWAAALGVLAFVTLGYWNHEAWIVRTNVERGVRTGVMDATYLVRGLSLDAVPALVRAQGSAPEPVAGPLRDALRARYTGVRVRDCRWFEWNLRQAQAAHALEAAGLGLALNARSGRQGCVRLELPSP